jgi:uncharacterized damage-inducible protein DinB
MTYDHPVIPESAVPRAALPAFAHVVAIYASETNKVAAVWREFSDADLDFRPDPRSSTVGEIMKHQLLSERRFFGEFLGHSELAVADVLPALILVETCIARLAQLATPRLAFLADRSQEWWLENAPFFDVRRERIWIFWRRVLHTAHHRTQLSVYLRLLGKAVPSTYGPTADMTWEGADPTTVRKYGL